MGTIVFGMMQSLEGYVAGVDGELEPPLHLPPGIALFRKPYFAAARTPLRLVGTDLVGEDAVRLVLVPN